MAQHITQSCHTCQLSKNPPKPQKGIYRPVHTGTPWEILSMDVVGPITPPSNGYKYILSCKVSSNNLTEAVYTPDYHNNLDLLLLLLIGLFHEMD